MLQDRRVCTNISQFKLFEKIYNKIANSNRREIVERFGCVFPCEYQEWRLVEQLPLGSGNRKVALSLATTDTILKEILKYSYQIPISHLVLGTRLSFAFLFAQREAGAGQVGGFGAEASALTNQEAVCVE